MNLGDLVAGLEVGPLDAAARGVRVCDITDDSRTVVPGSLFIARAGAKADGRSFVNDALAAGSVAVLSDQPIEATGRNRAPVVVAKDLARVAAVIAERFYGNPSHRLTLVGITGTKGKTTTAHLAHQIINGSGARCGLIGTVVVDDGASVGPATLTTPPATELSRTFGLMVDAGCAAAVMEVSSHALEQGRVAALDFNIGVFTNLTGDHLDYHGTMENYAAAKARLFEMLPQDGWAVVNAADPWTRRMLQECRARVLSCGVDDGTATPKPDIKGEPCTVRVLGVTMAGTHAEFSGPWGKFVADLKLVGRHNAMNALEAVAACHAAGVTADALRRGIETAVAPPGRLEPVTSASDPFAILVDYAHTDDAIRKVLEALRPLVPGGGRLVIVFGCGGDRDRTKRPRMGRAAAELADAVYVTSDNPRTERPAAIIDEILAGIGEPARVKITVDADRRRAIFRAVEAARPGDMIVIAGKGHETEQIIADGKGGTLRLHFDDREVAAQALAARRHAEVEVVVGAKPARAAADGGAEPAEPDDDIR